MLGTGVLVIILDTFHADSQLDLLILQYQLDKIDIVSARILQQSHPRRDSCCLSGYRPKGYAILVLTTESDESSWFLETEDSSSDYSAPD